MPGMDDDLQSVLRAGCGPGIGQMHPFGDGQGRPFTGGSRHENPSDTPTRQETRLGLDGTGHQGPGGIEGGMNRRREALEIRVQSRPSPVARGQARKTSRSRWVRRCR